MKAEDIRKKYDDSRGAVINTNDWILWTLTEIAAQLAELNAHRSSANSARERREFLGRKAK